MHCMGRMIGSEVARMRRSGADALTRAARRAVLLCASLVLVFAAQAVGQPSEGELDLGGTTYALQTARHKGFEAVRWSDVPEALASGSFQRGGVATAMVAGVPLELRVGSPFGRHGESVFQLSNAPYRQGAEVWVPLELFRDWLPAIAVAREPATAGFEEPIPAMAVAKADPRPTPGSRRPGPWRVVIDAGHGGVDPGTISPRTRANSSWPRSCAGVAGSSRCSPETGTCSSK